MLDFDFYYYYVHLISSFKLPSVTFSEIFYNFDEFLLLLFFFFLSIILLFFENNIKSIFFNIKIIILILLFLIFNKCLIFVILNDKIIYVMAFFIILSFIFIEALFKIDQKVKINEKTSEFIIKFLLFYFFFINIKYIFSINNTDNYFNIITYDFNNNNVYFIKLICVVYAIFILHVNKNFINNKIYFLTFVINLFFNLLLIKTYNLIIFYFVLELSSITMIFLFYQQYKYKTTLNIIESSIKYIQISAISSVFYFIGLLIIFNISKTLNVLELYDYILLNNNIVLDDNRFYIFIVGSFIFILSFFLKIGLAPFYNWLPEIYSGVSIMSLYIIGLLNKIPLIYFFYSILLLFFKIYYSINISLINIYFFLFILSIILGIIGGIIQRNVKKLYGYSSLVNISIFLFSIVIIYLFDFVYSFIFLDIYLLLNFLFLLGLSYLYKLNKIYINNWKLTKYINIKIVFFWIILLFSFISIPPFITFFSKLLVLLNIIIIKNTCYFFLYLFLLFIIIWNTYYYLRIIKIILFDKGNERLYYLLKNTNFIINNIFLYNDWIFLGFILILFNIFINKIFQYMYIILVLNNYNTIF